MASDEPGKIGSKNLNSVEKHPSSLKPIPDQVYWSSTQLQESPPYSQATTYSFTDVSATIVLPFTTIVKGGNSSSKCELPGLTLLSLSEHRDVYPVVGLGRKGIKGFTTGHRTTAGTLGFILFGTNPFSEAIKKYDAWRQMTSQSRFTGPDELPPFDLIVNFAKPDANILDTPEKN